MNKELSETHSIVHPFVNEETDDSNESSYLRAGSKYTRPYKTRSLLKDIPRDYSEEIEIYFE